MKLESSNAATVPRADQPPPLFQQRALGPSPPKSSSFPSDNPVGPSSSATEGDSFDEPDEPHEPHERPNLETLDFSNHYQVFKFVEDNPGTDAELAIAHYHRTHTFKNLDHYRPVRPPDRPATFVVDDDQLLNELRTARHSKTADGLDLLSAFGRWRSAVLLAETKTESNLCLLLTALKRFNDIDDPDSADTIVRFLGAFYGYHIKIDHPSDVREINNLSALLSERRDILSRTLRGDCTAPPPRETP